ncbi:hypothetical protein [Streptomyces sp. NPDC127098]|uniref:hypothetical protein n=1 Tax=Streptomyces sp. NPDC127098 TaxID=3347137 RepID=UPI003665CBE8
MTAEAVNQAGNLGSLTGGATGAFGDTAVCLGALDLDVAASALLAAFGLWRVRRRLN